MNFFSVQRVENGFIVTQDHRGNPCVAGKVWVFADEKVLAKWIEKDMPKLLEAVKK